MAPRLDPQIEAWLRAYPAPDVDPWDVAAVRELAAAYMADRGGPAPRWPRDDVTLTDANVGGVPVLIWSPRTRNSERQNPVVIALHGGAFVVGSALGAERIAMPLAADHQITTVSVEYRLAPEHPFPAAFDDVVAVLMNLSELPDIDGDRIAVHGSSAGGALAAATALWARDHGVDLKLQSLTCPALDHLSAQCEHLSASMSGVSPTLRREAVIAMWHHYLSTIEPTPYAVPALADDLVGLAPAHITIAEYDVLRDEALIYAERLRAAGVTVDVDRTVGTVHGFDGLLTDSNVASRAVTRQVEALANALGR